MDLSELKLQLEEKRVNLFEYKRFIREKINDVCLEYFGSIIDLGFDIDVNNDVSSMQFTKLRDGYSYASEMLTIYFRNIDYDYYSPIKDVEASFYTTTSNNDFEFKRMMLIGKVGEVLLNQKDNLITDINNVLAEFRGDFKIKYKEYFELQSKINNIEKEQAKKEEEEKNSKLINLAINEGVEFESAKIDMNTKGYRRNINKIKILNQTTSGKSATIKIIFERGNIEVFKNVKMKNILDTFNTYKITNLSAS